MFNYLIRVAWLKCPVLPLALTEWPNDVDSMRQISMIDAEYTAVQIKALQMSVTG